MNRRSLFWVGLAAVLVATALFTSGRRNETGQPLDPDSTGPLGTKALVELVEAFGGTVERGFPGPETTVTLVLNDQLSSDQRLEFGEWVSLGGRAIVVDPSSSLVSEWVVPAGTELDSLSSGVCSVPGLGGLELQAGRFVLYQRATQTATLSCFGDGERSYLHRSVVGSGTVVALGGGVALTNQYLDEGDNAVLATELLFGADGGQGGGQTRVSMLFDPPLTPGSRSLSDLIPTRVRWTGAQLLVAFGVYLLWRVRRFGRPVVEPQAVELPGSLLTRASGELHRRSKGYAEADRSLRLHLERSLRRDLKVAPDVPTPDLIDLVSETGGVERAAVERVLDAPVADDRAGLVELMAAVDTVNHAFDHGRPERVGDRT